MQVVNPTAGDENIEKIRGHWKGIEMPQDEDSYDGKTVYLPNSEQLAILENSVKVYFYPYFKSDEFEAATTAKSIVYTIGRKRVRSDYSFVGDTLVLTMHFINKVFIKMYEPMEMDETVLSELDTYGFNPSSLAHEFELDTLHANLRRGYKNFDSLNFEVLQHIQFLSDDLVKLNRTETSSFSRGYQTVKYLFKGKEEEFKVYRVEGTQQFSIIPVSQCYCDTIHLPYITVSWADRIRERVADDWDY